MHGILPANPPPDRPPVQVGAHGPSASAAPDTGPGSFADYIRRQSQPSPQPREPEPRDDRPPDPVRASDPAGPDPAFTHTGHQPQEPAAERGVKRDRVTPRDESGDQTGTSKPAVAKETLPEGEPTRKENESAAEFVDPKRVSQLNDTTGMSPAAEPRTAESDSSAETGLLKHAEAAAAKKQAQADAASRDRGTDPDAGATGRMPGPDETAGKKAGATESRTGSQDAVGEDTGPLAENGAPRPEVNAATAEEASAAAAATATDSPELTRSPERQAPAARALAGRTRAVEGRSRLREDRVGRKRSSVSDTGAAGGAGARKAGGEAVANPSMPVHEIEVNLSEQASRSGAESAGDMPRDAGSEGGEALSALMRSDASAGSPQSAARSSMLEQASQTLTRRLNGELGDSIVRQAKVMLRNAESAEIRLVIRPPELGRVRIQLQVENGHIAGRILVDNGNVRELMEQNLSALQRAFEEAGMELGDLDVSTGDARDERDAQHAATSRGAGGRRPAAGAESLEQSVTRISEYEPGRHRINLVA